MTTDTAVKQSRLSRPNCRVSHAWLSDDDYLELEILAAERGTHADRLAAEILHAVLNRNPNPRKLVQALLS